MVFNPNLESAPAPEQPVYSNISTGSSGGMATVAGNALEMLGGFFSQASERRQNQRAAQVRQSFLDNLESVRGLVDEGNFNQASITAGQAVSAYLAAGGSFDTETRAAATAITGLPEDMFGVSPQALAAEAEMQRMTTLIQDDTFQAYMQLERNANPNASEQELFGLAEARYNQANADAQLLIEAQNTGQLNFEAEGRAAINRTLDDFTQSRLGVLADAIFNGVPTDPRQIDRVRVEWNALQSALNGTLGNVSDDQRAEVTARFDNITSIIDNLNTVISTEGQQERLNGFVMQLMVDGDLTDHTTSEILGAVLASNDLTSFIMGGQEPAMFFNSPTGRQFIGDVMNRLEISFNDTVRREAYAALPTQADGTVNRNGVITFNDLPDSVRQDVEGITDDRLVSSIRVDGMLLGDVTGQDVTSAQQADRLTASTYRLGAFMLSTQGRPLSPALIRQLGLTEGLNDRLSTVEALGLDDEGEASARITLRSGISTQISSQQNYVRRLEETAAETGLRWNAETGEYEITNQDFIRSFAESVGMNPNMLMENGVVRLRADTTRDEGWRSQLRQRVGRLDEAFAGREALGLLQGAFDSLRVEMPEDQAVTADGTGFNYNLPEEVAADTDFLNAAQATSDNLGINVNDLLRVIEFETAGTWSPSVSAPTSSATGLIQFIESTAQGLGTSTAELATMTRAEQMRYVEDYLRPFAGRLRNFGDLYMAVHWPAGVGQSDDYVMYREGSEAYTANRGLDSNGDGTVTRGETLAVIERNVPSQGGAIRVETLPPVGTTTTPQEPATRPTINIPQVQVEAPTMQAPEAPQPVEVPVVEQEPPSIGEQLRLFAPSLEGEPQVPSNTASLRTPVSAVENLPNSVMRSLEDWNRDIEETKEHYRSAGVLEVVRLIEQAGEATPENTYYAGDVINKMIGILEGVYQAGDYVVSGGEGSQGVYIVRPYDVNWVRSNYSSAQDIIDDIMRRRRELEGQ